MCIEIGLFCPVHSGEHMVSRGPWASPHPYQPFNLKSKTRKNETRGCRYNPYKIL